MRLNDYYSEQDNSIVFTRQQASDFAKNIAGDFNPIHDVDSKRFCVPGDLLFSVSLKKYGLSQQMRFTFSGMVSDNTPILFPEAQDEITICDANGKEYLSLNRTGDTSRDEALIESLTKSYVAFSGQTFPHILVPLMEKNNAMINPARPLVIYESMSIDMNRLNVSEVELKLADATMAVDGKRGVATLHFDLMAGSENVGRGTKSMVCSGLRPFNKDEMAPLIDDYISRKECATNT